MIGPPEFIVASPRLYVPTSMPTRCSRCKERLFIAPTGQDLRAKHNLTVICPRCTRDMGRPMIAMPQTPEQIAEGRAYRQ